MFLTGYHGTTLDRANNIIKDKRFNISDGDSEWLGNGIYFYFDISDAYGWKETEAIMHSVIKINETEYLDLDSENGAEMCRKMIDYISETQGKTVYDSRGVQQNQCALMRMLWKEYPNIKVISASFPTEKTKIKTLIDVRHRRREFCVRNNNYIKCTQLIRKDDLE